MTRPSVSVVIETINVRENPLSASFADDMSATMAALQAQTYPCESMEVIVVVDDQVDATTVEEIGRRWPQVSMASSACNYFAAKNAGAARARGEIIALVDSDSVPVAEWMDLVVARIEEGADVVAGRTRYAGESSLRRTMSVPGFAWVMEDETGAATGFNLSNVAFRREVLLSHPLDERIRRNGACYLLCAQLRAAGARIVYEPRAVVAHAFDERFIRKHFYRGYDAFDVHYADDRGVLRATPWVRRFGALALLPITGRRIVKDWISLVRQGTQIGVSGLAVPILGAVALATRVVEMSGGMVAAWRRRTEGRGDAARR